MQTSVLKKKTDLQNMAANLKQLVGKQSLTEGEYFGIQFIRPKDKEKSYIAKASEADGEHSYIIVMHFNDLIRNKLREKDQLTDEFIEDAMQEITLANLSRGGKLSDLRGMQRLAGMKGTESMVAKKGNNFDLTKFEDNLNKNNANISKSLVGEASTKSLMPQKGKKNNMMAIINEGAKVAENKKRMLRKQSMKSGIIDFTPKKVDEKNMSDAKKKTNEKRELELKEINIQDKLNDEPSLDSHFIASDEDITNVNTKPAIKA